MKGKAKCKALKEIRKRIAEENDIEYAVSECTHKGDCLGTCPKCEAEVRYLEKELAVRQKLGKAVMVAGVATAVMTTLTGCDFDNIKLGNGESKEERIAGKISDEDYGKEKDKKKGKSCDFWDEVNGNRDERDYELDGDIREPEPPEEIDGDIAEPEYPDDLEGDVVLIDEDN